METQSTSSRVYRCCTHAEELRITARITSPSLHLDLLESFALFSDHYQIKRLNVVDSRGESNAVS
jgi:hypothetical protein